MRSRNLSALFIAIAALAAVASAQKPLDHDVYEIWTAIDDEAISSDGRFILYSLTHEVGDGAIQIHNLQDDHTHIFERGVDGAFSFDASHAAFRIKPAHEDVRQAKRDKKKGDDLPKDALGLVDLSSGELITIDRIKSFAMPDKAGGWIAVLLEKPAKEEKKNAEDADQEESNEPGPEAEPEVAPEVIPEIEPTPEPEPETEPETEPEEESDTTDDEKKKDKKEGTELLLINLASGERSSFDNVLEYTFDENAHYLAFTRSSKDGEDDGVFVVELATVDLFDVMTGEGNYKSLAFDKAGEQLAFLSNRDDYAADEPAWTLHHWRAGADTSVTVAALGDDGISEGWWISEHRAPSFSESGDRLFFGTAPRPEPKPDPKDPDTPLDDELPKLDIWHWNEPDLQTMQLNNLDSDKKRNYLAVIDLANGNELIQLADEEVRSVQVGTKGDANIAVGEHDEPYRKSIQWDVQVPTNIIVIDPATGERETILENVKAQRWGGDWLSPDAKYVHYWDYANSAWMAYDIKAQELINLSESIPTSVSDELNDSPSLPGPYGIAGWLEGDDGVLIYDRFDIWLVDPAKPGSPRNLTENVGRNENIRFRVIDLDREVEFIDPSEPLLLSAFDEITKNEGFYRDRVRGRRKPEQLLMAARDFSTPRKAEEADVLWLTRESFREFPDLWVSGMDFSDMEKVSDANPQQSDYAWGDVKLIDWTSARGEPLEGLLYTPPGFDPKKQYPMMVYFYERNSDNLHSYAPPTPHRSIIRFSYYASRGYVVFVPDIIYNDGYPGRSAMECVIPGVTKLIDKGFVDPERIAMQGHSWGGYQSAYIITQTDMFACAGSGAPVANMTSAYGGIRWGSGMSRQFQYEQTQSRIGGTLWEKPMLYLENSPLFHLENVNTPVLILHNDEDGAVPWYQGVELFMGLRRLDKPAWLLNYNGEPHWPVKYPNRRDYAIRMQQFFDHFLMDAPMPAWMAEGVPAVEKGRSFGLEPVDDR